MHAKQATAPTATPPARVCRGPRPPSALARPAPPSLPRSVAAGATGIAERESTRRGGVITPGSPRRTRDRSAWVPPTAPVLSGSGGGIFFFWQLGAIDYMARHYDLSRVRLRGASAGGLAVTLAACGVPASTALDAAADLAESHGLFDRPLGLAGVWGGIVRDWLHSLLPADAASRCAGRLSLVVTGVPSMRLASVDCFATKDELVDACLASAHIPYFLDGKPFARYKGRPLLDGSLYDFVFQNNSHLLTSDGAYVLDYAHDTDLVVGNRLAFLSNVGAASARGLMEAGADYARRQMESGVLDAHFAAVRWTDAPGVAAMAGLAV